jgi:hypothetical protein
VRLVKRSGVDHTIGAVYAPSDELMIRHGTDVRREGRIEKIDPYDLMLALS